MAIINGTGGADILTGTAEDDIFNAGLGADGMTGGLGHDTYYVDDANDIITEEVGEGTDTVYSSIDFTLPDNVENLTLTGAARLAVGNAWDNTLTGTAGDDTLYGGGGADLMIGGKGDDTFYINIFNSSGVNEIIGSTDVIQDRGGHDTVRSAGIGSGQTFNYVMQKGLEDALFELVDVNMNVTGNTSVNVITTDNGDDTLIGGRGADTMVGGEGDDAYYIDNRNDLVVENLLEGDDRAVVSVSYTMTAGMNVETVEAVAGRTLNITGNGDDNILVGNARNNTLRGESGDDRLEGGGGKDNLYGGAGADTFVLSRHDGATTINTTIRDFSIADGDIIDISDLLTGYTSSAAVSGFVHIEDKGKNSVIYINSDGMGSDFVKVGQILNITGLTGEEALLTAGILIAESV